MYFCSLFLSFKKQLSVAKKNYSEILFDSLSGNQFQLDTTKIIITAINSNNDTIWKTDPWKDNNLEEYRYKRPIIIYFRLVKSERTDNKEIIWIAYNSTQFGFVDKETGKFSWQGND